MRASNSLNRLAGPCDRRRSKQTMQLTRDGRAFEKSTAEMDRTRYLLYGEFAIGKRNAGRPRLRYKDTIKAAGKECQIDDVETAAQKNRTEARIQKRLRRKNPDKATQTGYACATCGRSCKGRVGLMAHVRLKHNAAAIHNRRWPNRPYVPTHRNEYSLDKIFQYI